jgi:superoxide dismutase, Cu-Zn family
LKNQSEFRNENKKGAVPMKKILLLGLLGVPLLVSSAWLVSTVYALGDAKAIIRDANGNIVGSAEFDQKRNGVEVEASVHNLPPGFHGFHIHSVGSCVPPFTSAGGHLNPSGLNHPSHAGDMPVLLINEDGKGEIEFKTDRFTVADLFDADGSALIIHANPDNYANVTRYGTPDASTLATGDAGGRIACGVIEEDLD